jgi:DNA-directed RNA polymerase subunit N (RpoN/RPB10)
MRIFIHQFTFFVNNLNYCMYIIRSNTMESMLCYECGAMISGKYKAFLYLRDILSDNNVPDTHFINTDNSMKLDVIYNALHINNYCTRMHFQTAQKRE